jgi:DNA-binding transcriptional LysR family regulator
VEVALREVSLEDGVARLDEGELDLSVSFEYPVAPVGLAGSHGRAELLEDPTYLLLRRDHPLAERDPLRLEDLREEPWVQFTHGDASRALYRAFVSAGYEPRIVLETDDLSAIQGLVVAGVGSTLVPGMALPTLRAGLVVRSLGAALPVRRVHALWPAGGAAPAAAAMVPILEGEGRRLSARLERRLGEARARAAG